jgi:hypothetical protein
MKKFGLAAVLVSSVVMFGAAAQAQAAFFAKPSRIAVEELNICSAVIIPLPEDGGAEIHVQLHNSQGNSGFDGGTFTTFFAGFLYNQPSEYSPEFVREEIISNIRHVACNKQDVRCDQTNLYDFEGTSIFTGTSVFCN